MPWLSDQDKPEGLTGNMPYRIAPVDSFCYSDILLRINTYRALVFSQQRHRDTVRIDEGAWMKAWTSNAAGKK